MKKYSIVLLSILAAALLPRLVHAHSPVVVEDVLNSSSGIIEITDPEISKAFYDSLTGLPRMYEIRSDKPFHLYLNILTPENSNPNGKFAASVYMGEGGEREVIASVDGTTGELTNFHETFANDNYLKGPEFEKDMDPGTYQIEVTGIGNSGNYVLAVGKEEKFVITETIHALNTIPHLKRTFFKTSPATFLFSILGIMHLLVSVGIGFGVGALARVRIQKRELPDEQLVEQKNVGKKFRIGLFVGGDAALILGIMVWNPILFMLAGMLYCEATLGWSSIYHFLQKHTKQSI